jgi:hypothetical protein
VAEDTGRPGPPPVGSVAEEAARLLDALGGWAGNHGYAAGRDTADVADTGRGDTGTGGRDDSGTAGRDAAGDDAGRAAGDGTSEPPRRCEHCGAVTGAAATSSCQWCPVCQGLDLLRSVRPETVERLADLAGAVASALRDVAARGHGPHGPGAGTQTGGRGAHADGAAARRADRVQDITIEDEDQGSATV